MQDVSFRNFRILGYLGAGSFGQVLLVEQISDGSKLVVKRVPCGNIQQANSALVEAKVLLSLAHKNIVKYDNFFLEQANTPGLGFFVCTVMEYCPGGDLDTLVELSQTTALEEQQLLAIARNVCRALDHLRKHNVIHRDIKPGNIFVGSDGEMKLGDLGVARQLDSVDTTSSVQGTPLYMAPEVMGHMSYSFPADMWSLGAVLFELASGVSLYTRWQHSRFFLNKVRDQRSLYGELEHRGYSRALCRMICDMLSQNSVMRPTPAQILGAPILVDVGPDVDKSLIQSVKSKSSSPHKSPVIGPRTVVEHQHYTENIQASMMAFHEPNPQSATPGKGPKLDVGHRPAWRATLQRGEEPPRHVIMVKRYAMCAAHPVRHIDGAGGADDLDEQRRRAEKMTLHGRHRDLHMNELYSGRDPQVRTDERDYNSRHDIGRRDRTFGLPNKTGMTLHSSAERSLGGDAHTQSHLRLEPEVRAHDDPQLGGQECIGRTGSSNVSVTETPQQDELAHLRAHDPFAYLMSNVGVTGSPIQRKLAVLSNADFQKQIFDRCANRRLNLYLVGEPGHGKSSLVNSFYKVLGQKMDRPALTSGDASANCTLHLLRYDDLPFTIWDTMGVSGGSRNVLKQLFSGELQPGESMQKIRRVGLGGKRHPPHVIIFVVRGTVEEFPNALGQLLRELSRTTNHGRVPVLAAITHCDDKSHFNPDLSGAARRVAGAEEVFPISNYISPLQESSEDYDNFLLNLLFHAVDTAATVYDHHQRRRH